MKYKSRSPRYLANDYIYRNNKTVNKHKFDLKFNLMKVMGGILLFFGTVGVFSRTVVYTPMRLINNMGGAKFSIAALLLFLGIFVVVMSYKKALGYLIIGCGLIFMVFSVFLTLRLGFLQTSLVKTLMYFGTMVIGIGLFIKSIIKF